MEANADNGHLIVSSDENISVKLENVHVENSQCEKLLGIQIDNKLSFKNHVNAMCNKTSQKLNALARISPYMNISQRRIIIIIIIRLLSFGVDVPLRALNNRINKLHERALRVV